MEVVRGGRGPRVAGRVGPRATHEALHMPSNVRDGPVMAQRTCAISALQPSTVRIAFCELP